MITVPIPDPEISTLFYPPPDEVRGGVIGVASDVRRAHSLSVGPLFSEQVAETSGWISLILDTLPLGGVMCFLWFWKVYLLKWPTIGYN